MVNRNTKKYGNRPEGFEPSAVHAGKPTRLCYLFESLTVTITNITPFLSGVKEDFR
jgi:hypothetical protein